MEVENHHAAARSEECPSPSGGALRAGGRREPVFHCFGALGPVVLGKMVQSKPREVSSDLN